MEVIYERGYKPIGLGEAIERQMDEGPEGRAIALLIEMLHEKGILTEDDVMAFLPKHYEVARPSPEDSRG